MSGMSVCCECCVLSGRGLCVGLITRPEEYYRVWCVSVWSWSLDRTWPTRGCCAMGGKKFSMGKFNQYLNTGFIEYKKEVTTNQWWDFPSECVEFHLPFPCAFVMRCLSTKKNFCLFNAWQTHDFLYNRSLGQMKTYVCYFSVRIHFDLQQLSLVIT
jgi:hypothetical protein